MRRRLKRPSGRRLKIRLLMGKIIPDEFVQHNPRFAKWMSKFYSTKKSGKHLSYLIGSDSYILE